MASTANKIITNNDCESSLKQCLHKAKNKLSISSFANYTEDRWTCYVTRQECFMKVIINNKENNGHTYYPANDK